MMQKYMKIAMIDTSGFFKKKKMLFSDDILGYSSGIGIQENLNCLHSHFIFLLK
jgi:hypothetical protein